jgi:hypothetical protein
MYIFDEFLLIPRGHQVFKVRNIFHMKCIESRVFLLFLRYDRRIWIRIHTSDKWIRNQEAQKHTDPQHCFV